MKSALPLLFIVFCVASCTVEKRLYNRGWNVQWRKHYKVYKTEEVTSDREDITEYRFAESSGEVEEKVLSMDFRDGEDQIANTFELFQEDDTEVTLVGLQVPKDTTKKNTKSPHPDLESDHSENSRQNSARAYRNTGITLLIFGFVMILVVIFVGPLLLSAAVTFVDILGVLFLGFLVFIVGLVCLLTGLAFVGKSKKIQQ